jgi:quinol-cytochrome oxidoreductase complex cytochrome b subunit
MASNMGKTCFFFMLNLGTEGSPIDQPDSYHNQQMYNQPDTLPAWTIVPAYGLVEGVKNQSDPQVNSGILIGAGQKEVKTKQNECPIAHTVYVD